MDFHRTKWIKVFFIKFRVTIIDDTDEDYFKLFKEQGLFLNYFIFNDIFMN